MNTSRKSAFFTFAALAILALGTLASCNKNAERNAEIESMESRLNAIIMEHEQMKADYEIYTSSMADKDSTIEAKTREIRSLISQLKEAREGNSAQATAKDNSAELARMAADIKAKQKQIEDLEARLQKQLDNAAAMQQEVAQDKTVNNGDRRQLERLQRQVNDQDQIIARLTNTNVQLTNHNDSLTSQVSYLAKHQGNASETAAYVAQVEQLQQQIADQQDELSRMKNELNQQQAAVAEAQQQAEAANKAADEARSEASTRKAVSKKMQELEELCASYAKEIEQLRAENAQLRSENENLRGQMDNMREEAEQTSIEYAKLAIKVSRAAVLVTKDLTVTPLKVTNATKGKETNRAANTGALKIDGYILDNNVVEPGTITLYARVTDPQGRVIEDMGNEPYFEINGIRMLYTASQNIEFTGEGRSFKMSWCCEEGRFTPGNYKLTLYANGNTIGTSTFRLK